MTQPALDFQGKRVSGKKAVASIEAAIARMETHPQCPRRDAVIESLQQKLEAARRGETFIVRDVTEDWIGYVGGQIAIVSKHTRLASHVPAYRDIKLDKVDW